MCWKIIYILFAMINKINFDKMLFAKVQHVHDPTVYMTNVILQDPSGTQVHILAIHWLKKQLKHGTYSVYTHIVLEITVAYHANWRNFHWKMMLSIAVIQSYWPWHYLKVEPCIALYNMLIIVASKREQAIKV